MNELQNKIQELVRLNIEKKNEDWRKKMQQQDALINEIKALAKANDTLLGRILKFPMADSYAMYVITKVNKASVGVMWLNYCDGWVDDRLGKIGKLPMQYARSTVNGADRLEELFSRKKS